MYLFYIVTVGLSWRHQYTAVNPGRAAAGVGVRRIFDSEVLGGCDAGGYQQCYGHLADSADTDQRGGCRVVHCFDSVSPLWSGRHWWQHVQYVPTEQFHHLVVHVLFISHISLISFVCFCLLVLTFLKCDTFSYYYLYLYCLNAGFRMISKTMPLFVTSSTYC